MQKQTPLEEARKKMRELLDKQQEDLEAIYRLQATARTEIEAAGLALKDAAERMDIAAYTAADQARNTARIGLEMYQARQQQILKKELITEAESDKVINSLLDLERQLAEDFEAALIAPLVQLAELQRDHMARIREVESVLDAWQRDIHANYDTRGVTRYYDEKTGEYTSRSKIPVAVHSAPYRGCEASLKVEKWLKDQMREFIPEE